jgi:hypothetical protein
MASFKDKNGQEWTVSLDPVIADEIEQKHKIQIVNLQEDPLLKLRTDPMTAVAVLYLICQDQVKERSLSPAQFAKCLPFPPDEWLKAIEESIVSFFPTGRASHVREVLTSYANMADKTAGLITAKMHSVMDDPRLAKTLNDKADIEIDRAMQRLIDLPLGT